jgi:hypothetical protein
MGLIDQNDGGGSSFENGVTLFLAWHLHMHEIV